MNERYCIVIPHYRHHQPLSRLVPELVQYKLPVYIVDDASGAESQAVLKSLEDHYDNLHLLIRTHNGGKGAAMMTGLTTAAAQGYTHAISLDADGQHDVGDLPKLQSASQQSPASIISGRPVFGNDIPASRLYGRMLTNGLVKLVTGSTMIKDAMCGFRVYPLQTVLRLSDALGYRTRMEFDVEILVRACWASVDIRTVETRVIYPEDGASHFNLVSDNVRLIGMHMLLLLSALGRLPKLLITRFLKQRGETL
jgi:glycosyltransferase involved in cell wall biosynthesis